MAPGGVRKSGVKAAANSQQLKATTLGKTT